MVEYCGGEANDSVHEVLLVTRTPPSPVCGYTEESCSIGSCPAVNP